MTVAKIRVVIADDHPLVRKGLAVTLKAEADIEVLSEATDGATVQLLSKKWAPDIVLLDLNMPGASAFETIALVHEHSPQTRILILTAFDDPDSLRHLTAAGVTGYLLKEEALGVVVQAIRTVMQGGKWVSDSVLTKLLVHSSDDVQAHHRSVALTAREIQLLKLMAQGLSDYEIGQMLGFAERTVRHHLRVIYDKLGIQTRVEAAVHAVRLGLLDGKN